MFRKNDPRRVLIHVDLRRRDLMHSVWLKHWLEQMGAEVRLCSRVTILREFERFRPHATILSHTYSFGNQHGELLDRAKRTRVFVLPTEDARDDTQNYLSSHEPGWHERGGSEPKWLPHITCLYCWGPINKRRILEAGLMPEDRVIVCGIPRFDVAWESLFSEPMTGKPIGIVGNFGDLNPWDFYTRPWPFMPGQTRQRGYVLRRFLDGPQYYFNMIECTRAGGEINYPPNRNTEDALWGSIANLRLIFDFLDRWTKLGGKTILRPHSLERFQSYDLLLERYRPHLEINNDPAFFLFLQKVSGVLFMSSTAVLEGLLAKRPIIALESLLKGRYREHCEGTWRRAPYLDYMWQPDWMDTLIDMAQAATRGELATCPDPTLFREHLDEHYGWPRSEPSTLTVAKDVMNFLSQDDFEPPAVSPWRQLQNELDYDSYMFARRARNVFSPENRYRDRLEHHLGISRAEEEDMLRYLRRN